MSPFQKNKQSIAPLTKASITMPDFKYVIWDVDGTILNSEPIHQISVVKTCQEADVDVDGDSIVQFLGKSHFDTWEKVIQNSDYDRPFDEFLAKCTGHYIENLDKIELRQDVLDVMHILDGEGISQSIFSNNPGSIVFPTASVIEGKIGKRGFFEQVVSLNGTQAIPKELARKPDPDGYFFTLNILETLAQYSLVIEDSATGTAASTAAGIFTIGWAHGNEEDLKKTGTDLIVTGNLMDAFNGKAVSNSAQTQGHNLQTSIRR